MQLKEVSIISTSPENSYNLDIFNNPSTNESDSLEITSDRNNPVELPGSPQSTPIRSTNSVIKKLFGMLCYIMDLEKVYKKL